MAFKGLWRVAGGAVQAGAARKIDTCRSAEFSRFEPSGGALGVTETVRGGLYRGIIPGFDVGRLVR